MMIISLEAVVLYLPQIYWLIERNLPGLLELLGGKAESSTDGKLKGQSHIAKAFSNETHASNPPGEAFLLSEVWHPHVQVGESHLR